MIRANLGVTKGGRHVHQLVQLRRFLEKLLLPLDLAQARHFVEVAASLLFQAGLSGFFHSPRVHESHVNPVLGSVSLERGLADSEIVRVLAAEPLRREEEQYADESSAARSNVV